jgi:hypothetical protein
VLVQTSCTLFVKSSDEPTAFLSYWKSIQLEPFQRKKNNVRYRMDTLGADTTRKESIELQFTLAHLFIHRYERCLFGNKSTWHRLNCLMRNNLCRVYWLNFCGTIKWRTWKNDNNHEGELLITATINQRVYCLYFKQKRKRFKFGGLGLFVFPKCVTFQIVTKFGAASKRQAC